MKRNPLADLADEMSRQAASRGAEEAEAFVRSSESIRIEIKDGVVEGLRRTSEVSAALRVLKDGRTGFSFATRPTPAAIGGMADLAMESARLLPCSPMSRFSASSRPGPAERILDGDGLAASFDRKADLARQVESAALGAHPAITKARKPTYAEHRRATVIRNAQGSWESEDATFSLAVEAVAEAKGESQIAYDYQVCRQMAELDPAATGRRAGQEAAGRLGARVLSSGVLPAVFVPKMAAEILDILATSFSAHEMQKGRSRLAGRVGEKVFSERVTIMDNGAIPGGIGTVPFDDEGVPPVPRRLVSEGVLSGCFHTLLTAARQKEQPTGNGFRMGVGSMPSPVATNVFIEPGGEPVDHALPKGAVLRVEFLLGSHTADRVTGDFSLGAAGSILENGERTGAFGGVTISGNLFDLFSNLVAVGNDLVFYGAIGAPSLLTGSMILSGR